jgi:hypothetical protein
MIQNFKKIIITTQHLRTHTQIRSIFFGVKYPLYPQWNIACVKVHCPKPKFMLEMLKPPFGRKGVHSLPQYVVPILPRGRFFHLGGQKTIWKLNIGFVSSDSLYQFSWKYLSCLQCNTMPVTLPLLTPTLVLQRGGF